MAILNHKIDEGRLLSGTQYKQASGFDYLTLSELRSLIADPQQMQHLDPIEAKRECRWVLPCDAPARTKEVVEEHNSFQILWVDIDQGDFPLDEIQEKLNGLGLSGYVVYSTLRHKYEDPKLGSLGRRWRVIVFLQSPIETGTWQLCQEYLIASLDADPCSSKPTQILFLPAVCSTDSYEHYLHNGLPLNLNNPVSKFLREAKRFKKPSLEIVPASVPPALSHSESLLKGQLSVVEAVNSKHSCMKSLLLQLGFKKQQNKFVHPDSSSGQAGVAILENRYYSHHESDPLNDGHTHDAFDVLVHRKFNGDADAAIKHYGAKCKTKEGLTITEHNQRVYREGDSKPAKAIKSLNDYSVSDSLWEELTKQMREAVFYINYLAVSGQITVFHAPPNGGKTLFSIAGIIDGVESGRVQGSDIYYLNCDDNLEGALEKIKIMNPLEINTLLPGIQDFNPSDFYELLSLMIERDECEGKVLILDTLTKFVDNMDHKEEKRHYNQWGQFRMKGGSMLILTHQNKNPGPNGKRPISGTSALMNNVDVVFGMQNLVKDENQTTVEFYNEKGRGLVVDRLAWSYSNRARSYQEKLNSIEVLDEDSSLRISEMRRMSDLEDKHQDVVDQIKFCLSDGPMLKTQLIKSVQALTGNTRKTVESVLSNHTGTDKELRQYWRFEKGDKNSLTYQLNDD